MNDGDQGMQAMYWKLTTSNLRNALAVPAVDGRASSLSTSGRASPTLTTTLSIESSTLSGLAGHGGCLSLSRSRGGGRHGVATSRALERRGSRNCVWSPRVVGNGSLVDVNYDTRVVSLVGTRERDGVATDGRSTTRDVNLSAANVELSTALGVSRVQGKKLNTHEVVARCNASGHFEVLPSAILDHAVNTPLTVVVGQAIVVNLEPALTVRTSACGIVDLGKPDGDRALVTGSDGMVGVVGDLRATDNMAPPCTNTGTSGNLDDVVILVLEILVAGEIRIVDVLDRVV